jgi:hypothetical protein
MATPQKLPSETQYGDIERGMFRPPVKKVIPAIPPKEFTSVDIPMTKNLSDTIAVQKVANRWSLSDIKTAKVGSRRRRVTKKKTSKRSTRRRK